MNVKDKDIMLPYEIIARMNRLRKDKPDDPEDLVWVSDKGERYVLTPKGFVNAIQYSYIILHKQTQKELELLRQELIELKIKHGNHKCQTIEDSDLIGRKSKKKINGILNGANYRTVEDRFEAIRQYLKMKE